jgi:hypothetical protein
LTIVNNIPASDKKYSMKIPGVTSVNCKIRITDMENSGIKDESDVVFKVIQPVILVTSPVGGEKWLAGTTREITWSSSNIKNVKIEYTTNSGKDWQLIITSVSASSGSCYFTVPVISSTQCKVRISDASDADIKDESASVFTIANPGITVVTPNGGEKWTSSETKEIIWTSKDISNVKIDYTTNNGTSWISILNSISANTTSYLWTVPTITSISCKLRISDVDNSRISDESNGLFEISLPVGIENEMNGSIPEKYLLLQSYPNPFNPSTVISYELPSTTFISLKVYNVLGEEVSTLVNEVKSAGRYKIVFNAGNISSGIYFYVLQTANFVQSKKMIFLK